MSTLLRQHVSINSEIQTAPFLVTCPEDSDTTCGRIHIDDRCVEHFNLFQSYGGSFEKIESKVDSFRQEFKKSLLFESDIFDDTIVL